MSLFVHWATLKRLHDTVGDELRELLHLKQSLERTKAKLVVQLEQQIADLKAQLEIVQANR